MVFVFALCLRLFVVFRQLFSFNGSDRRRRCEVRRLLAVRVVSFGHGTFRVWRTWPVLAFGISVVSW